MEVVHAVMPHMNQEMIAKVPMLLVAVLNATKAIIADAEKGYSDKDMDEQLQNELDEEIEEIEEVWVYLFRYTSISRRSSNWLEIERTS